MSSSANDSKLKEFTFERTIAINDFPLSEAMDLDKSLSKHFDQAAGGQHTFLLLDPALSHEFGSGNSVAVQMFTAFFKFSKLTRDNYYRIAIEQVNIEIFRRFVSAIFYVGAERNDKLGDQNLLWDSSSTSPKNEHIRKILETGKGPVPMLGFTGLSRREAQFRVALMINAIGGHNLTNQNVAVSQKLLEEYDFLEDSRKRIVLGTYLLLKSFLRFASNGQRQWRPSPSAARGNENLLNKILNEQAISSSSADSLDEID